MAVVKNLIIHDRVEAMLAGFAASRKVGGFRHHVCAPGEDDKCYADPSFDDSGWIVSENGVPVKRDQGKTWYRFEWTVPESQMGMASVGDSFRLAHFFFAPVDIHVDGVLRFSERSWMDFKSPECVFAEPAVPGLRYSVAVALHLGEHCYWNGHTGMNVRSDRLEELEFTLISFRDELAWASGFDEVAAILPLVEARLLDALSDSCDASRIDGAVSECRELLRPMEARAKTRTVHLIGHAHIDMNWFWSMDETVDVIRRDFDTMLRLMEEFPDFRFSHSQCATYEIAEREFTAIFDRVKKAVAQGSWEVTASTWTEGDLNMADGEAIVRHVLLAKRWLAARLGVEPRIMWCPDTFGHPASLPQILRKSGIDRYFFMRCGPGVDQAPEDRENRLREARHNPTFIWRGLEGSTVTAANLVYGTDVWTAGLLAQSDRMKEGFGIDHALFVYGTGDHGGGPTRRDIRRVIELAKSPATPNIRFDSTEGFFSALEVAGAEKKLPLHEGELNTVFDGCYTTHADIKRLNRLCENALRTAETLVAALGIRPGDRDRLEAAWKTTLFNQFHDIFDGSGVGRTYEHSRRTADEALADLDRLVSERIGELAAMAARRKEASHSGKSNNFFVWNPASAVRRACLVLYWEGEGTPLAFDAAGNSLRIQPAAAWDAGDGRTGSRWVVELADIPSLGAACVVLRAAEGRDAEESARAGAAHQPIVDNGSHFAFETELYKIEVDKGSGQIETLFDKRIGRFLVRRGSFAWRDRNGYLNRLSVHDEEPADMSAWCIGRVARTRNLISGAKASVIEDGPARRVLRFEHQVDSSRIEQELVFEAGSPRIEARTRVEWNEWGDFDRPAPMLRVSFSPDLVCDNALYEIPFAVIAHPGADRERPALRFVDLPDRSGAFGFALLNDCKHGHRVSGNLLELALIRSGWLPDQKSDVGSHQFTYAILPHAGDAFSAGVPAEAAFLNLPLRVAPCDGSFTSFSLATVVEGQGIISALKPAEEGDGWILRVYDPTGRGGACTIKVADLREGLAASRIEETDLLERPIGGSVESTGDGLRLELGPYDIRTIHLSPAAAGVNGQGARQ